MTKNEIVGRLKDGGLDASSTNRSAAVYVTDARSGRSDAGWFAYRIICNSEETERRARAILSRWYDIETSGNVWRLKSKNRIPLMAIKRGAAPSTNGYMYLEAAQANSTVSMVSTLETAPNLEYSTDGVTWQEWQHTTTDGTHTFSTITLGAVGDKIYFRGNNPDGLGDSDDEDWQSSVFMLTGAVNAGGNVMSLLDKTMELTEVPAGGFLGLFGNPPFSPGTALVSANILSSITKIGVNGCNTMFGFCSALTFSANMPAVTTIGEGGCGGMYGGCTSLTAAAAMPALTTIGDNGCDSMYFDCTFNMSNDGTTLNFAFPTPPVTAGETTFSTAYNVAQWMGNTNGF